MRRFGSWYLLLGAAAVTAIAVVGCSDSSNKNRIDQITGLSGFAVDNGLALSADPSRIVIDPDDTSTPTDPANGNKRYGETALTATARDGDGHPQAGLAVTFGAAAGKLASNGQPVTTDAEGVARDTLRVYEDDPGSIEVTAGDGSRVATIVVTKVVATRPVADAGPDQLAVECTGNLEAPVHLDGSASSDANGDITLYEWFEFYGTPQQTLLGTGAGLTVNLALGTHTITLQVTDATAKTSTDDVVVTVVDTRPPLVHLEASPSVLWPPNHRLVDVGIAARIEECRPYTVTLESVESSEPDNGTGDGDTAGDIQGAEVGTADHDLALRAERAGGGSGRVYTIVYKVVDAEGLETVATTWVTVPHDRSGH